MRRPIVYGWIVVAVTAVVSFAVAVGLPVFGLAGPLSGWLMPSVPAGAGA